MKAPTCFDFGVASDLLSKVLSSLRQVGFLVRMTWLDGDGLFLRFGDHVTRRYTCRPTRSPTDRNSAWPESPRSMRWPRPT